MGVIGAHRYFFHVLIIMCLCPKAPPSVSKISLPLHQQQAKGKDTSKCIPGNHNITPSKGYRPPRSTVRKTVCSNSTDILSYKQMFLEYIFCLMRIFYCLVPQNAITHRYPACRWYALNRGTPVTGCIGKHDTPAQDHLKKFLFLHNQWAVCCVETDRCG